MPLLFVGLFEGALRLCGYGYSPRLLLRLPSGDGFVTNDHFARAWRGRASTLRPFFFKIPEKKPAGTVRICLLGESAAMGTPDPAFSFGRILETELRYQFPERQIEVLNAAMRGINSHMIRAIAREMSRHEVDAFVIYMGNNEANGLHSPTPQSPTWTQSLPLLRAVDSLRTTRLGQLLLSVSKTGNPPQDTPHFRAHRMRADDPRQLKVVQNFKSNLDDICRTATNSGAKVILCTVVANLRDCPPLGSLHRLGLTPSEEQTWDQALRQGAALEAAGNVAAAIQSYQRAKAIDDHFAELQFRLARCLLATGDVESAARAYAAARDWDALQFRADSRLNAAIRQCASEHPAGLWLLDAQQALARPDLCAHGIPGAELFHDHVHPTFTGAFVFATNCVPTLTRALGPLLGNPASVLLLSERECREALAYTAYDENNVLEAMAALTARPPFVDQLDHQLRQQAAEADLHQRRARFTRQEADACLETYRAALKRNPACWPIRYNFAMLCAGLGLAPEALREFRALVHDYPDHPAFRITLASELAQLGDRSAASEQLRHLIKIDPQNSQARDALARLGSAN